MVVTDFEFKLQIQWLIDSLIDWFIHSLNTINTKIIYLITRCIAWNQLIVSCIDTTFAMRYFLNTWKKRFTFVFSPSSEQLTINRLAPFRSGTVSPGYFQVSPLYRIDPFESFDQPLISHRHQPWSKQRLLFVAGVDRRRRWRTAVRSSSTRSLWSSAAAAAAAAAATAAAPRGSGHWLIRIVDHLSQMLPHLQKYRT